MYLVGYFIRHKHIVCCLYSLVFLPAGTSRDISCRPALRAHDRQPHQQDTVNAQN